MVIILRLVAKRTYLFMENPADVSAAPLGPPLAVTVTPAVEVLAPPPTRTSPPLAIEQTYAAVDLTATYAGRNPLKEIIHPRQKATVTKTDAQKRADALKRSQGRSKLEELKADVDALQASQEEAIKELSKRHGKKVEYVRRMVLGTSLYKKPRRPGLQNALISAKAKELNEGKSHTCHGICLLNIPSRSRCG